MEAGCGHQRSPRLLRVESRLSPPSPPTPSPRRNFRLPTEHGGEGENTSGRWGAKPPTFLNTKPLPLPLATFRRRPLCRGRGKGRGSDLRTRGLYRTERPLRGTETRLDERIASTPSAPGEWHRSS